MQSKLHRFREPKGARQQQPMTEPQAQPQKRKPSMLVAALGSQIVRGGTVPAAEGGGGESGGGSTETARANDPSSVEQAALRIPLPVGQVLEAHVQEELLDLERCEATAVQGHAAWPSDGRQHAQQWLEAAACRGDWQPRQQQQQQQQQQQSQHSGQRRQLPPPPAQPHRAQVLVLGGAPQVTAPTNRRQLAQLQRDTLLPAKRQRQAAAAAQFNFYTDGGGAWAGEDIGLDGAEHAGIRMPVTEVAPPQRRHSALEINDSDEDEDARVAATNSETLVPESGGDLPDGTAAVAKTAEDDTGVLYGIADVPAWWMCILLGFQTYLTMLGASVLIPLILVPAMGGTTADLAEVICTCFFSSGINTLLQTLLGARLPIVQGGSFAYISPVLAISASIANSGMTFPSDHDRFIYTMREVQGGVIGSALIALGLALFGIFLWMLKHLSAVTISCNIAILGLSLYAAGWPAMGACIQLGLPVMCLIIIFAFHMKRVKIFGLAVFALFPVILGLGLTWLYAYIATVAGAYDNSSEATQNSCTTHQSNFGNILSIAPWFRVPYPCQWGAPIFSATGVLTLIAAVIPAALESIGDYFAAARLSGAPRPPSDVISRALAVESLACVVAGLFGTTAGSTAYAENVGAIAITRVASRRVTQTGALIMILLGTIGKFGALFASIPQAMVAGMFTNERNFFILGFGLYSGLSIPDYFTQYTADTGHGPVDTGSETVDNILNALFSTPAAVSLVACLLLDLTIPRANGKRPQEGWQQQLESSGKWWEDEEMERAYGWPFHLTPKWRRLVDPYKSAAWAALVRCGSLLSCSSCRKHLPCRPRQGRRGSVGGARVGREGEAERAAHGTSLPLSLRPQRTSDVELLA
ncbi:Nucleobase-ascorbate transporter 1 [Chlorella vulgaris]